MRFFMRPLVAVMVVAPVLFGASAFAKDSAAVSFIKQWDPDHDGTLDVNEVNAAADAAFDKLDKDHDGTLDLKELGHRVTKGEFTAADPDHDGTLDKTEYHTLVQKRFEAADPDKDGTIDVKELNSAAGRRLLELLR
jgi:Ca2+-binding EF-hand superfamily protein